MYSVLAYPGLLESAAPVDAKTGQEQGSVKDILMSPKTDALFQGIIRAHKRVLPPLLTAGGLDSPAHVCKINSDASEACPKMHSDASREYPGLALSESSVSRWGIVSKSSGGGVDSGSTITGKLVFDDSVEESSEDRCLQGCMCVCACLYARIPRLV